MAPDPRAVLESIERGPQSFVRRYSERVLEHREYCERVPRRELGAEIDALWSLDSAGGAREQIIVPDGCVDVIFDLGGSRPHAFVVGTMTRAERVASDQPMHLVAVRFKPGVAAGWLGLPLEELTDRELDLAQVWPDSHRLVERLVRAPDAARALELALVERLAFRTAPDPWLRAVVREVCAVAPARGLDALAREFGATRQHLTRRFRREVGIGPKMLARVARMRRALAAVESAPRAPLAEIALACGYVDQAHLSNELRALTGHSPRELRELGSKSPSPSVLGVLP